MFKSINCRNGFTLICLIGCSFQLQQILINYLNYDYKTRVTISTQGQGDQPDLVLCTEIVLLVDPIKFVLHQPDLASSMSANDSRLWFKLIQTDIHPLTEKLTMSLTIDQISDILYTPVDLFDKVAIKSKHSTKIYDLCHLRKFYNGQNFCVTFQCNYDNQVTELESKSQFEFHQPNLVRIHLNQSLFRHISRLFATLVKSERLTWDKRNNWASLALTSDSNIYTIDFTILRTVSLPAPFSTNCLHYPNFGFTSRAFARQICLNKESLRLLGNPFHSTVIEPDLELSLGTPRYKKNSENVTYQKIVHEIVRKCYQKFSNVDCMDDVFLVEANPALRLTQNETIIQLNTNKGPNFVVILEPASTLTELCISIASIISSWFGISLSYQTQKMMEILKIFSKNYLPKGQPHSRWKSLFNKKSENKSTQRYKGKNVQSSKGKVFIRKDYTNRPYILAYQESLSKRYNSTRTSGQSPDLYLG